MDFEPIRTEIASNALNLKNEKKLVEFKASNGQIISLYKEQALSGSMQIMVHPQLNAQLFAGLPGAEANVKFPLRDGSNMRRFPKRQSGTAINPMALWTIHESRDSWCIGKSSICIGKRVDAGKNSLSG